jgi:pyridoxal phosphate enzyme (YggS family)
MGSNSYVSFLKKVEAKCRSLSRDPKEVTVVAVSKGISLEQLLLAYEAGCRDFGENRIPEALEKIEHSPDSIRWHFIGTLQKNKVRKGVGRFCLIHSVDSVELAKKISEVSVELKLLTQVLLQVNTSKESSKHGLSPKEWKESYLQIASLRGIKVMGLMTLAPLTEDVAWIRSCFRELRSLRDTLETMGKKLPFLSMGMSQDWEIALEEGATHLRVGTAIFK